MKNKGFHKLFKKNKSHFQSGFTLTELLVGLFMSIFVVGALGFGVMQVLRATQTETAKTNARNETARAIDFIADEIKRAETIEVDTTIASIQNAAVAPNFPPLKNGLNDIAPVLALKIPGVSQRVIYSVAPPQTNQSWEGPRVIYRWGPTFEADGTYATTGAQRVDNPAGWTTQALIDKVDDTSTIATCNGSDVNYVGFYACVVDDDGDGITENETTDVNSNGVIDNDDIDGLAISAQLFFTGGIDTASGSSSGNYIAETQVVARARSAPANDTDTFTSYTMSYKSLSAEYNCAVGSSGFWQMRTDFANNPANLNDSTKWVHNPNVNVDRQPQPITIDISNPLKISSLPVGTSSCDSLGNPTLGNSESIYELDNITQKTGIHVVEHTIDFANANSFNGNKRIDSNYQNINVNGDNSIYILKEGSVLSASPSTGQALLYNGFDPNTGDPADVQSSLGAFLQSKHYATYDAVAQEYTVSGLGANDRILAFEIGQTDNGISGHANDAGSDGVSHPGFEVQDNVIILSSDAFGKEYEVADFQ